MHGLAVQGAGAHGPKPAGMLRIRQGGQERYIWPVHLPGWLAEGWRVAGAEPTAVGTPTVDLPEPIAAPSGNHADADDGGAGSPRGRRGRRRKEETLAAASAVISATSEVSNGDAIGTEPSESVKEADDAAELEAPLSALPDDLFDDPLT